MTVDAQAIDSLATTVAIKMGFGGGCAPGDDMAAESDGKGCYRDDFCRQISPPLFRRKWILPG